MTFARHGQLKYKAARLWAAVVASWGIAFLDDWAAVPANRIGSPDQSAAELKTVQEAITLPVFAGFSVLCPKEPIGWNDLVGFALISADAFIFSRR